MSACVPNKPTKSVVSVYVQKPRPEPITSTEPDPGHAADPADTEQRSGGFNEPETSTTVKGKEIMIFNSFDILQSHDDAADGSSRVLLAAPLLVTHDKCSHMECSGPEQEGSSGCRSNFGCGFQLAYLCHDYCFYGDNEIGARRDLWQALCSMAGLIGQEQWLVGGDFNAAQDLSEVCGASWDIRLAMHDFNDCILRAGLIALPMRGVLYSWHNRCTDGRSLWKRLDRLLVNDRWLE
ncbi:UNVERIFIED_CONTAM: hypothetical protein Sangu_3001100 [Sesamum angustifolium]|uniref:Endonuclease/exonuclease/phosphatase domain-containing protein n=1 Tax=Sesamum angustifolium TaxID=2727405 RepID=A0AAW2KQQ0_9LAMI